MNCEEPRPTVLTSFFKHRGRFRSRCNADATSTPTVTSAETDSAAPLGTMEEPPATEADTKTCVLCGSAFSGSAHGVVLTLCCSECCEKAQTTDGRVRVARSNAISTYHCKPADLDKLNYSTSRNPHHARFAPMLLYLIAEVQYLGERRVELTREKAAEKAEKEHRLLIKRKRNLLKKLKLTRTYIRDEENRTLFCFVLGDYLLKARAQSKLRDVLGRWAVMERVRSIVRTCEKAHPAAAFEFCLTRPEAPVSAFAELRDKMRLSFHLEGARILYRLSHSELEALREGPLGDDYRDFKSRDSYAIVRSLLERRLDEAEVREIMERCDTRSRIDRGALESDIAEKLLEFWSERHDRAKRRARLAAACAAKDVGFPYGSFRAEEYLSGRFDCDAEDLVALYKYRAKVNCSASSFRGQKGEEHLWRCLHWNKLGFDESVSAAVRHAWTGMPPRRYYKDDGTDPMSDCSDCSSVGYGEPKRRRRRDWLDFY